MQKKFNRLIVGISFVIIFVAYGNAQSNGGATAQSITAPATPPPPATKMEGFKPAAGSVVTFGYDKLGGIQGIQDRQCPVCLISVDVRELRSDKGATVRGLLVEVTESQYQQESSFIDADEIPDLLKGIDALLEVKANPTQFENFEVRYTTRGELQLIAFSSSNEGILYAVQAGRLLKAKVLGLSAEKMQGLRGSFQAAGQKLATLGPAK